MSAPNPAHVYLMDRLKTVCDLVDTPLDKVQYGAAFLAGYILASEEPLNPMLRARNLEAHKLMAALKVEEDALLLSQS